MLLRTPGSEPRGGEPRAGESQAPAHSRGTTGRGRLASRPRSRKPPGTPAAAPPSCPAKQPGVTTRRVHGPHTGRRVCGALAGVRGGAAAAPPISSTARARRAVYRALRKPPSTLANCGDSQVETRAHPRHSRVTEAPGRRDPGTRRSLQPGTLGDPWMEPHSRRQAGARAPDPLLPGPGLEGAAGGGDSASSRRSASRVGAGGPQSAGGDGDGAGAGAGVPRPGGRKGPPGGARGLGAAVTNPTH